MLSRSGSSKEFAFKWSCEVGNWRSLLRSGDDASDGMVKANRNNDRFTLGPGTCAVPLPDF